MKNLNAEQIIEKHSGLVYKSLKNYSYCSKEMKEDLTQEGFMALIRAYETFDETKGVKFSSYAMRCIINGMYTYYSRTTEGLYKDGREIECFGGLVSMQTKIDGEGDVSTLEDMLGEWDEDDLTMDILDLAERSGIRKMREQVELSLQGFTKYEIEKKLNKSYQVQQTHREKFKAYLDRVGYFKN